MHRLLIAALLLAPLLACETDLFTPEPGERPPAADADVVIVSGSRGRQGPAVWALTLEFQNPGGPGTFYLHLQGVSSDPDGPRTECGLTQTVDAPGSWHQVKDFVIECPRAPQWVTVYTRSDGEDEYRETDVWVY